MTDWTQETATAIATAVRGGTVTARAVTEAALARTTALNPTLNAFTAITQDRALTQADRVDAALRIGADPGPMAGVTFAVKNLFDLAGLPTLAGSRINRDHPPATSDATLVSRLERAGAICTGALNMGEYAYDFTGENAHDGPSRNPHDPTRMSGGSSGGSGAAVASGMVQLSLGSDTNGSIRVPSALCGLFGLKPTYGRLSRGGTFPFVASLDHLGPLARSTADLALSYDAMLGPDNRDTAQADKPAVTLSPLLASGTNGLRIACAVGYFAKGASPGALTALHTVATALKADRDIDIAGADIARASAYLITMSEGASLHLERMKTRHADYDPDVRDRLMAGAMIPGAWVAKAHKYRRIFRDQMLALFQTTDVILAPATPCSAPLIGQKTLILDGVELPLRPNLGIFTQPVSFAGLPVVSVPVWPDHGWPDHGWPDHNWPDHNWPDQNQSANSMPIGVQIIAAPWREDICMRVAYALEQAGVVRAPVARGL